MNITHTSPSYRATEAATNAHNFLFRLNAMLNDGASSDEVWNYCIENAKAAKFNLALALNYYEGRTGSRELSTS